MATEVVGIQLELMGAEGVYRDLKKLQDITEGFRGSKGRIEIESNLSKAKADIIAYRGELEKLKRAYRDARDTMKSNANNPESEEYKDAAEEVKTLTKEINVYKDKLWDAQQRTREFTKALKDMGEVKTFGQMFSESSLHIARFGGALQSLGNTLTKISRPFQNLFRGTVFAAGYKLLGLFTSSLSESVERFDTMNTYIPVMRSLGAGLSDDYAEASEQLRIAQDKMYESIIGLPTGLDEIIDRWKLLTVATKDYSLAADLAIAENNAIIASGAEENTANISRRMLQTYFTTGELNARQWNSLLKGMPVAWSIMEKHLQESGRISGSLMENMQSGKLSAEEFAQALIEAGQSPELQSILNQMKHTFSSALANIGNFTRKMGEGVLRTFNEIFLEAYGKDLIDMLNDVSATIERVTPIVQDWIRSHKDLFVGFVDAVKSLDWKGFFTGLADGLALTLEQATKLIELISKRGGLYNVGRFFSRAGMWGKAFTLLGGIIKGLRHPLAAIITLTKFGVRGLMGYGIFGNIGVMMFGKGNKGLLTMGRGVAQAPSVVDSLRRIVDSLAGLATIAGGALMIGGTVWALVQMVKSVFKAFKEISDLSGDIDWELVKKVGVITAIIEATGFSLGALVGGLSGMTFGSLLESQVLAGIGMIGLILTEVLAFAALDTWLIEKTVNNIKNAVQGVLDALNIINEIRNTSVNFDAVKNTFNSLSELRNLFMPEAGESSGLGGISESMARSMAEKATAMKDIIVAVKDSADALAKFGDMPDVSFAATRIERIIEDFNTIYLKISGSEIGAKDAKKNAANFDDTIGSVISIINAIHSSIETLQALSEAEIDLDKLTDEDGIIAQFAELKNKMFSKFRKPQESAKHQSEDMAYFDELFTSFASIVQNIGESVKAMSALFADIDYEYIFDDIQRFGELLRDLSTMMKEFRGDEATGGVYSFAGSKNLAEGIGDFVLAIKNVGSAIKEMGEVSKIISDEDINVDSLGDDLVPFIESMNKVGASINKLNSADVGAKLDLMSSALGKVKTLMADVQSMASGETSFEGAANTMSAFATALGDMSEQILAIAQTWNESFVEGLNMDGILEAVESGVERILSYLQGKNGEFAQKGVNNGMAYANGIRSQLSNINVTSTVNVSAVLGSVSNLGALRSGVESAVQQGLRSVPINAHRGGLVRTVYRAKGGGIFTPRGTDTIPAMLTPGEFVQNRKAVNAFGIDFMRKVNALDVRGAMDSLRARMASRLSANRISTVNNVVNNNNNQRVTQNVYTNNPNFAFKRSSRYVGAI